VLNEQDQKVKIYEIKDSHGSDHVES